MNRRYDIYKGTLVVKMPAGILKDKSASTKDLHEVKSILKAEPRSARSEPEVHSILKSSHDARHQLEATVSLPEVRGILKKAKSEDISSLDSEEVRSILKHTDSEEEEGSGKQRSRSNSQPLGILKHENSPLSGDHPLEIKGILKTPSHENVPEVIKSAMRRGSADSDCSTTGVLKSAFKRSTHSSESEDGHYEAGTSSTEIKSILHKPSLEQDDSLDLNSHKHVDLTISISDYPSNHPHDHHPNPPTSSNLTSCSESSVTINVEVKVTSTTSVTTETTEKSTLQVPEDLDARSGTSASEGEGESSAGELLDTPRTKLKRRSRVVDKTGER